jgi:hypothetical protein
MLPIVQSLHNLFNPSKNHLSKMTNGTLQSQLIVKSSQKVEQCINSQWNLRITHRWFRNRTNNNRSSRPPISIQLLLRKRRSLKWSKERVKKCFIMRICLLSKLFTRVSKSKLMIKTMTKNSIEFLSRHWRSQSKDMRLIWENRKMKNSQYWIRTQREDKIR